MSRKILISGLSAAGLKNRDINRQQNGLTDPFVRFTAPSGASVDSKEIRNCLDPVWADTEVLTLEVKEAGEELLKVKVEMFDFDWNAEGQGEGHDFLGSVEVDMSAEEGSGSFELQGGKEGSTVSFSWRPVPPPKEKRKIRIYGFAAAGLKNRDMNKFTNGLTDPFIRFTPPVGSSLDTSEIRNTLDPVWPISELLTMEVEEGELKMKVELYDYDWNAEGEGYGHDFLGSVEVDMSALESSGTYTLEGGKEGSTVTFKWDTILPPAPPVVEDSDEETDEEEVEVAPGNEQPKVKKKIPKKPFGIYVHDEATMRPRLIFGGVMPVTVKAKDTIASLKAQILDLGGVPVEDQRLVLNGDMSKDPLITPADQLRWQQFRWKQICDAPAKRLILEDDKKIKDYYIYPGVTLLLVD